SSEDYTVNSKSSASLNVKWNTAGREEIGTYTASAMVFADGKEYGPVSGRFLIEPKADLLSVVPSDISLTVLHNSQQSFDLNLKNNGLTTINDIHLTPTGSIAPWTTLSKTHISSLDPAQSDNVSVAITVPKYQTPATYTGSIDITSDNGGSAYVQVSVTVPKSYEVDSSVTPTHNSAVPGDTASYTVSVKNEGNVIDRYAPLIENSTSAGDGNISKSWVSASKINITLNPGITDTLTLDIMPPRRWSTMPGMYNFVVNVSSQNTFDTNDATLEVLNFSDVSIEITGAQAVNPPENPIDPDLERIIKENPSGKVKVIIKTKGKPGSAESTQIEKEGGK
ncbi:hypothetical protein KA005_38435, partial [bacterium]|nr:hypothetical protein [bacterium]